MNAAVVIGAGVAGMASAIRLSVEGWQVKVLEQAEAPGGKLREIQIGGFRFDAGPSLFTWPDLVMELDALVRNALPTADLPPFAYYKLDRSAHYFWPNGKRWIAWSDRSKRQRSVDQTWGPGVGAKLEHYLDDAQAAFVATRPLFLECSLHEPETYAPKRLIKMGRQLHRLPLFGTMHSRNSKYGLPVELVQFLDRYATYNGSDPMRAPAMLQVIPHLEHGMGTFFPHGGMIAITRHLHLLAEAVGVEFHLNCSAERIDHANGRVTGVSSSKGFFPAQLVVSNADVHPTYTRLLPDLVAPKGTLTRERSTSGLIFYWGMDRKFPGLHLHNLFFSKDYESEFKHLRTQGHPGDDLTAYVNITSKCCPSDAPSGGENWFVLLNVAADPESMTTARIEQLKHATIVQINRALRQTGELEPDASIASHILLEQQLTPKDIETRTSSWKGALYGTSSNSPTAAFLRHRNRSKAVKGLYFCGGSVHPGGGIPLCLLSGKIVAEMAGKPEPAAP